MIWSNVTNYKRNNIINDREYNYQFKVNEGKRC